MHVTKPFKFVGFGDIHAQTLEIDRVPMGVYFADTGNVGRVRRPFVVVQTLDMSKLARKGLSSKAPHRFVKFSSDPVQH